VFAVVNKFHSSLTFASKASYSERLQGGVRTFKTKPE
jgi:hypothetical protein